MEIPDLSKPKDKRTETLTKIGDSYIKGLLEEEITIGELERVINYIGATIALKVNKLKEDKFVSELK